MQRIVLVVASQNTQVNLATIGTLTEEPLVSDLGNVVVVDPCNGILNWSNALAAKVTTNREITNANKVNNSFL